MIVLELLIIKFKDNIKRLSINGKELVKEKMVRV